MKSCFFIGHREASAQLLPALKEAVAHHIQAHGVKEFIVGNYGGFDRLVARVVIDAKKHYPDIALALLLPYHPAERPVELPPGFDYTFYPPSMENVPRKFAIVRANRYMIDNVDFLIAYAWHPASNARNLTEYAQKREKKHLITVTTIR